MEKKIWTRPLAEVEQFMANDYIAKCDDLVNKYYKFVCDGGRGVYGGVWQETNGVAGLQSSRSYYPNRVDADDRLSSGTSSYHACGATHYAPVDSTDFIYNCYYKRGGASDSSAIDVIVWRGLRNDNVHCTTNMKVDTEIVQGNRS